MTVGLFFGSFNPIHVGHMIIAQTMLEFAPIDQLWFIVSPQNPLKKNNPLLHEFDRYDMVEAATNYNPNLRVSDVEFSMPKPSFTIDTLTVLSEKNPDKQFFLIIGEDNLASFHKWKNHDQILKNYGLLVYPRPRAKEPKVEINENVKFIDAPLLDISATFIRNSIKNGHPIKYLVPEEVEEVIVRKGYYR